jgi:nitrogen fixation NifU-like protein
MTKDLKEMYNRLLLEKQKDPSGFEKREGASHILEAFNPLCGDRFTLYLDIEDDHIIAASYHGYGCALSKVSTALLIESLPGKSLEESKYIITNYFSELKHADQSSNDLVKALSLARNFPGREQCTLLSWDTLWKYLTSKT